MYYLILKDLTGDIKMLSNCTLQAHRQVIIKNYCMNNDITLVSCRQDINEQCNGDDQMFAYPILDNRFIILECTYHDSNIIFNRYIEKHTQGYFEFHYYNNVDLPLIKCKPVDITVIKSKPRDIISEPRDIISDSETEDEDAFNDYVLQKDYVCKKRYI